MNAKIENSSLQRQNTEISKQIFPEKEYRGLIKGIFVAVKFFLVALRPGIDSVILP
jgi:hypothetical protein